MTTPNTSQVTQLNAHETLDEAKDFFIVKDGKRCAGEHLIIDLYGADQLNDIEHIDRTLRACVDEADATLLHIHLHHFSPQGVSGVAVLAESHISVHTWPESRYAAFDVFMCGAAKPSVCVDILRDAFGAEKVEVTQHLRGTGLGQDIDEPSHVVNQTNASLADASQGELAL